MLRFLVVGIVVLACAAAVLAEGDEERNCKEALLHADLVGAYDCYKYNGDKYYRDALNALALGRYPEAMQKGKEAMRIKSGFGLCFQQDMCGGAAHAAILIGTAAEKAGSEGTAESYFKKGFAYAQHSGQCSGGDDEGRKLCALMYVLSAHDGFTKASTVQATEQCTLVSGSGNVKNLDVLYVGSGFTNISKYDAYVQGSAGTLLGFKPFDANKARLNVWRLNELTNFDCTILEPRMFSCSSAKIAQKRVTCPNDQVILVVDSNEWRGFGNVGGDISGTSSWKDMPYSVVLHEFGHAFGGLHDEYVYDAGQFAVDMNAPNCDAVACTKFTAAGVRGCFAGCGASTRYRSINNGMMRDLGATEFGQYDEKIIVDKLRGYG